MSTPNIPKWNFQADYLQACNCDYGCPCEFSAPPTAGYCEAAGIWQIRKGECAEIPLDGLSVAFAAHWPKAIHLGGGTVCVIVDERANADQREALTNIVAGKYGGVPYENDKAISHWFLTPNLSSQAYNLHFNRQFRQASHPLVFLCCRSRVRQLKRPIRSPL